MSAGLRKMTRRSRDSSLKRRRRVSTSSPLMPMAVSSWSAGSRSRPFGSANVSGAGMLPGPRDAGAQRLKLLLEGLVAAVEVVDARDLGGASRREPGQYERGRGAQIGRHDGRALVGVHAPHDGDGPLGLDEGAHAAELGRMHEAVVEDGLGDLA